MAWRPAPEHETELTESTMRTTTVLLASWFAVMAAAAPARDYTVRSLTVADPYSRATPKGSSVAAGYMKITNNGTEPDRLIGGSSDVASRFELHESTIEN